MEYKTTEGRLCGGCVDKHLCRQVMICRALSLDSYDDLQDIVPSHLLRSGLFPLYESRT